MYLKLAVFAICLTSTFAFPDGAPTAACTSLIPQHGQQLNFDLPLEVLFSSTSVSAGSLLTVSLRALNGTVFGDFQFRGFIVQARIDDGSGRVVGFFETGPGVRHVVCPTLYPESSVTHTIHDDKAFIQFNWRAPADVGGSPYVVRFYHTIVMNVGIYWSNQVSAPVTILPH
ncbi:hypothetical protein HA402_003449 [Bradysia odoriphaga]|nr:hypothetical protein HA402_003449 [Bradysia odoriphaga]